MLRLPRRGPFVVVAAETPNLGQEAIPFVEARLRVRGIGSAWRLLPDLQVGIVHLPQPARVGALVDALKDLANTRIGVSPTYAQLAETAASSRLARVAMMSTNAAGGQVTRFDDHPLAVAAVSSPDAMRRIAQTVPGPVLALPADQSSVLLQTLAAWRDSGGSVIATAKEMYCHPNTVRQRLRRLETSTNRSLTDPNDAAELLLALQANLLLPEL